MVSYDEMTPEGRERLAYLVLADDTLKAIVLIEQNLHRPGPAADKIMRFAFNVAVNRMTPSHLKKSASPRPGPPEKVGSMQGVGQNVSISAQRRSSR